MNRDVRKKLQMAVSVRGFSRAHPSPDANHSSVLSRLEVVVNRMDELGGQQVGGFLSKHSSVVRRKRIRRELHHGSLRYLVTIAESAALEKPELAELFHVYARALGITQGLHQGFL